MFEEELEITIKKYLTIYPGFDRETLLKWHITELAHETNERMLNANGQTN